MPSNSTPTYAVTTGDTTQTHMEGFMLASFIYDTSSLQDRLIMGSVKEDSQTPGNGAGYSGPKGSKL
ncbi:uncharacterized protein FTOL_04663 [Fusarium torulosum]|uniref:Uncharacterized protein n=1 Tax=Fusarium torulosum TaxID=33205 RepID=A0AAE8M673_9HYPO|nr:uncharacterized protein FTOL_04663 [Fusarium torulosum]